MHDLLNISKQSVAAASLEHLSPNQRRALRSVFPAFLDAALTSTGRATFHNTKDQQQRSLEVIHQALMAVDHGVYTLALLLPGVRDLSRQIGVKGLLGMKSNGRSLLAEPAETQILRCICEDLPPHRLFKLLRQLRAERVNNARTRKLILRTILNGRQLELWAVKYHRKLREALEHAWGKRTTSILQSIITKPVAQRSAKEMGILRNHLVRFIDIRQDRETVEECVGFILGNRLRLTLPLLCAFEAAKYDLERGANLPYEVLEGIRSRYHRHVDSSYVLALTRSHMTDGQKIALQAKAQQAGVSLKFDPVAYNAVRLYVYAFEMGMTPEIRKELIQKAKQAAAQLPMRFGHVGVLVDSSRSMKGHATQKYRPMAVALALSDLFYAMADDASIMTCEGRQVHAGELIEPAGDTALAEGLVHILRDEPDVVFVISDGYENAPAGRVSEVIRALRRMDVQTPIYQLSPVFAAESAAVRTLSEDIPAVSLGSIDGIGAGLLKLLFESDMEQVIGILVQIASARLKRPILLSQKAKILNHVHKEAM